MTPSRHLVGFSGQIIANTVVVPMATDPFLSFKCLGQVVGLCVSEQLGCRPQKLHPTTNINTNAHAVIILCQLMCFGFYVFGALASQPLDCQSEAVWGRKLILEWWRVLLWEPISQRSPPVSSSDIIHLLHPCWVGFSPLDNLSQSVPIHQSVEHRVRLNKSNWWEELCERCLCRLVLYHFSFSLSDFIIASNIFELSGFLMSLMRWPMLIFLKLQVFGSYEMAVVGEPSFQFSGGLLPAH